MLMLQLSAQIQKAVFQPVVDRVWTISLPAEEANRVMTGRRPETGVVLG